MIVDWSPDDDVMLAVVAETLASEFNKLKRIGDSYSKDLWHGYIPQTELVPAFWPSFIAAIEKLPKNKICNAVIEYSAVDDPSYIFATGIRITLITDIEARSINAETKSRAK